MFIPLLSHAGSPAIVALEIRTGTLAHQKLHDVDPTIGRCQMQ